MMPYEQYEQQAVIAHLGKLSRDFNVWSEWIDAIHSEREAIANLIRLRNEMSHPDFILVPEKIHQSDQEFEVLLTRLIPKLRAAVMGVDLLLHKSRSPAGVRDARWRSFVSSR
ncbi:MAG: hypothetical protein H7A51_02545 [Akkermansiaceae bacterium]|nr:hypothetical protein [Akkermansiaceae bacterium]